MGSDKGHLVYHSKSWAQHAYDKLKALDIVVNLSVNRQQQNNYEEGFSPNSLMVDVDLLSVKGPLLAVLSAHLKYPEEDLFLIACDLPLMETVVLKELVIIYRQKINYEAYVFTNSDEPEPLCGIYTPKGLARILVLLQQEKLARHSMKYMLSQLGVLYIPLPDEQKVCFCNFNEHSQLHGL